MGCFLACFATPKRRKPRKWANKTSGDQRLEATEAFQLTPLLKQEDIEKPIDPITESEVRLEEQSNCSAGKKVTFDLIVKTHEEKENENQGGGAKESKPILGLIASSILSFPADHRYQNCADCDEKYEDRDLVACDLDDDDEVGNDRSLVQEESSESLFSLSIDSRKQVSATETGEKEVNSPMPVNTSPYEELMTIGPNSNARDRSQCVHLVLKPIENLTQWKAVQAKTATPLMNQAKENVNLESPLQIGIGPEPSFKQSNRNFKPKSNNLNSGEQQIAVDTTSLSSWLAVSESTLKSNNSSNSVGNLPTEKANSTRSHEDRPILGALTLEELMQFSASISPRRSRSQSPDDKLIIGTVGSYWSHTGQSIDSDSGSSCKEMRKTGNKNKKDERVKWNSTPFKTRMERSLPEV